MQVLTYRPAILALLLAAPALPSFAADQNGYTAQYECRAGAPYCNVNVAALGARSCDQIIAPSTPWSSINWSNNTICISAGDHTSKGTLEIPASSNGSAGNYKVLRYYRDNDNGDEPWNQAEQARLYKLITRGSHYWVVHRLTFPGVNSSPGERVMPSVGSGATSNNLIFNQLLIEGSGNSGAAYSGFNIDCNQSTNFHDIILQNSVVRGFYGAYNTAPLAVWLQCGNNIRAVGNEIYDWSEHVIQAGHNGAPTMSGLVIENNDLYFTPAIYSSDGRAKGENLVALKLSGTSQSPARVIQNRFWGARETNTNECCIGGGGGGALIVNGRLDGGNRYILIKNNTITENQHGISWINGNNQRGSIVGNLLYRIRVYYSPTWWSHALNLEDAGYVETYLNTFVNADTYTVSGIDNDGNDIRCNAFIDSGRRAENNTPPSSSQADHNAFYGAQTIAFNASGTRLERGLSERASSTAYNVGDVVRFGTSDQCTVNNTQACFLYTAVQAGTTSGSSATPCTQLGCTFSDGSITWQAMRGPYFYWRKLRTSPERMVIPYAQPHTSALDTHKCPADFASRSGIGIGDSPN